MGKQSRIRAVRRAFRAGNIPSVLFDGVPGRALRRIAGDPPKYQPRKGETRITIYRASPWPAGSLGPVEMARMGKATRRAEKAKDLAPVGA